MASLEEIFQRQHQLQSESFGIELPMPETRDTVTFVDWNITAAMQELAEMRDEIAWKPWAIDRYEWANRDAIIKEGIDVLHFLVNIWLSLDADAEEVFARYMGKAAVNAKRQEAGYTHHYMKEIDGEGVRRALDEPEFQRGVDLVHGGSMEFDDFTEAELLEAIREGRTGLALTDDPEPQPGEGPDYYAEHAAWRARHQPKSDDSFVHQEGRTLSGDDLLALGSLADGSITFTETGLVGSNSPDDAVQSDDTTVEEGT